MRNKFKIIGESKPNKIRLKVENMNKIIELPKRRARLLMDSGMLNITNPDMLYHRI